MSASDPTGNWYAHTPRGQGTNMMEPQQNGSTSVAIDLNEFLGHGDEENGHPRVAFDLNEFPEPEDDEI